MGKFIAIVGSKSGIPVRDNIQLLQYLSSIPTKMVFLEGVILFEHAGTAADIHSKLATMLRPEIDLCVFEVADSAFCVYDDGRNERLRQIFWQ
jgi:hypothetical protein